MIRNSFSKVYRYIIFLLGFLLFTIFQVSAQDKLSMTVSQDGSGDFRSIQKAIDACKAFPDSRITIFVKNGIYKKRSLYRRAIPNFRSLVKVPIIRSSLLTITLIKSTGDETAPFTLTPCWYRPMILFWKT